MDTNDVNRIKTYVEVFDFTKKMAKKVLRILKEKQPKAFILENVKGLLSIQKGEIFDDSAVSVPRVAV